MTIFIRDHRTPGPPFIDTLGDTRTYVLAPAGVEAHADGGVVEVSDWSAAGIASRIKSLVADGARLVVVGEWDETFASELRASLGADRATVIGAGHQQTDQTIAALDRRSIQMTESTVVFLAASAVFLEGVVPGDGSFDRFEAALLADVGLRQYAAPDGSLAAVSVGHPLDTLNAFENVLGEARLHVFTGDHPAQLIAANMVESFATSTRGIHAIEDLTPESIARRIAEVCDELVDAPTRVIVVGAWLDADFVKFLEAELAWRVTGAATSVIACGRLGLLEREINLVGAAVAEVRR